MAESTVQKPIKPEKRRPKEEDYSVINLSMLTRFRIFVDEVRHSEGPISFRFFMKRRGSHRTMALTVDAIEHLSGQLMLRRHLLDAERKPTADFTYSYEVAQRVPTRRTNGISPRDVTAHGYAWANFGELIDTLLDVINDGELDVTETADYFRDMTKATRALAAGRKRKGGAP